MSSFPSSVLSLSMLEKTPRARGVGHSFTDGETEARREEIVC